MEQLEIAIKSGLTKLSDDVIGDDGTYNYYKITDTTSGATADQSLPGNGFLGVSYCDYTYTDENGYYNIQLPRNNNYRVSIWPPDAADVIGGYTGDNKQKELDRYAITNINDAIASFNFQSNKIATVFPFAILLIFLRIDLIFLNTLPTGGDMGAHIVPTKFFVEELFYNFKICIRVYLILQNKDG